MEGKQYQVCYNYGLWSSLILFVAGRLQKLVCGVTVILVSHNHSFLYLRTNKNAEKGLKSLIINAIIGLINFSSLLMSITDLYFNIQAQVSGYSLQRQFQWVS